MSQSRSRYGRLSVLVVVTTLILVGSVAGAGVIAGTPSTAAAGAITLDAVTEDAYLEPAPERGDEYFEAEASDGSWVSYDNPRDEYRSPYLGDGSGKICIALFNEAGEPIVGESVPGTTVTVPTGDSIAWHTGADPMTVQYPMTERDDWPLDSDQFGTADHVAQGDGYMDSHCIEFHGLPEDGTIEYGEAVIDGPHADRIEVVGYVQQDGQAWKTDVDPIEGAVSYEEAGGGWTYSEPSSHGQVVVVLQLEGDGGDDDTATTDDGAGDEASLDDASGDSDDTSVASRVDDRLPAFSPLVALAAIVALVAAYMTVSWRT